MLGRSQTIEEGDKSNRERTMNKLSEDNEALFTDATTTNDHPEGRIGRLKDGDFCEFLGEEDDADQKSITLEALKDASKSVQESQRDRDFVSQSSLTIVSDSDLFLENSRWLNSSTNDLNNHINNNSNNSNNTPTTNTSNNSNNNSISNHFHNTRRLTATRRRSSLLSDVTFESDDQTDDIDAQTTDSNDSSWANNSALLTTARRFASNYIPGGNNNETIEEEHHDYHEKLKQSRDGRATTAAPVIPLRRVSASYSGPTYGSHNAKTTLRAMTRGNAAAPTIPKRTSSHHSTLPSIKKNNAKVYQMYNASFSSIVDSQISFDTVPSFFEDRSAATVAAAAYLSSAAMASQQEEVRTVETALTSHTNDTAKLTNHGARRRSSREDVPVEAEAPPVLPERRGSKADFRPSFVISSSFDDDDEGEIPSVVHEEEPHHSTDSASAHPTTNTKTTIQAQPPIIPVRKNSVSQWVSEKIKPAQHSSSPSSSPSRLNTQPPTCPMRKDSNHHIRRSPNDAATAIPSPRIEKFESQDPSLVIVPPGLQPSHKRNKPPTKPTRTNSKTVSRSPASATSSS